MAAAHARLKNEFTESAIISWAGSLEFRESTQNDFESKLLVLSRNCEWFRVMTSDNYFKRLLTIIWCKALHSDISCMSSILIKILLDIISVLEWYCHIWATSWENLFMLYANNKGADQPAHPRSRISASVVCCLESITHLLAIAEILRL